MSGRGAGAGESVGAVAGAGGSLSAVASAGQVEEHVQVRVLDTGVAKGSGSVAGADEAE